MRSLVNNNNNARCSNLILLVIFLIVGFIVHYSDFQLPAAALIQQQSKEEEELFEDHNETVNELMEVNQYSHFSRMNRYPDEYQLAVDNLNLNHDSSKKNNNNTLIKILSFGSSYGMEAKTLGTIYFPTNSLIYGVDIDEKTLNKARKVVVAKKVAVAQQEQEQTASEATTTATTTGNTTTSAPIAAAAQYHFFNGLYTPITEFGPYDIIFANSVLCRHPVNIPGRCLTSENPTYNNCTVSEFEKVYPFQTFEETIQQIDTALAVNGLLAIINSAYDFTSTNIYKTKYEIILEEKGGLSLCEGNQVPRVNFTTQQLEVQLKRPCLYRKIMS